jgi:hypothetical protein
MGIITAEQKEQQQKNEDEKLRADIRKSLDVDTDSAGIVESLYKRIPTNARLLLENIAGVDTPITAEDFTKDELVEMVFLAEKQKQYNKRNEEMIRLGLKDEDITKENFDYLSKRAKTYEDTRGKTSVNPYKEVGDEAAAEERLVDKGYLDSIVDSFTDPRYGVATTLGKYTALDENGKISRIKDTYNFNKKQRNLPTDFIGAVKRIMISPELAGEYLANALGTEDREVDIKLPRKMKEGGMAKRMAKQMELFEPVERGFEEGGLMEEGGMVDEESGNEVPPGSLREEVRDDIPAQLSEGEFVFPADVVRYFGLEKLMEMRQEAKAGLARMEAMGQMGNSEEATLPDDIPFSIEDLDMEDEDEYNTPQEFAYGGIVQMPGTNFTTIPNPGTSTNFTTTPNPGPTTGFRPYVAPSIPGYTPQPIQTDPQYQGIQLPGTQFIGATEKTNIPTFTQTIGTNPGQYDEFRTYVNSSGQTLRIPFKNGQPLYPIPQGYTLQKEDAVKTESTVPTTTVGQDEGGDGDGGDRLSGTVGTTTLGTKTATDKEHEEAFGGNVNAMSHKGYSKAVATLGMNQLGTLGTTGLAQQMSNAFADTKMGESLGVPTFDTFNDVGIAMNQGRNMALSALGLGNMGQVTTNAQYDAITAAMVAAKESPARYGLAVSKALTEHQEAIKTGQVAAMQGMGFKSTDLSNPPAVEQARAFYDIDIGTIKTEIDEVTRAGTVRDKDGNPVTTKSGVVMTEKARQELKELNKTKQELEAKKTSLDLAAANDPQEGLPSGVPSSPADFGALSPEDIANAIDQANAPTMGIEETGPDRGNNNNEADGSNDGPSSGGPDGPSGEDPGTYICTASYANGIIPRDHFTSLKKYGIMLRRNDPYLMKAYDWFGPKLAAKVKDTGWTAALADLATAYYKARYTNTLSAKQKIYDKVTQTFVWPTLRLMGWVLTKVNK